MATYDHEAHAQRYVELLGEVPDSVTERWEWLEGKSRSTAVGHLERFREQAIHENPMGMKVTQLVQFGMMAALGREYGARVHAEAAVSHGATVEELIGVAEVAFVAGGALSYNLGISCARDAERKLKADNNGTV